MSNLPQDVSNQALDAAGIDFTLGDMEEGTRPAQVILRAYGQCLRQMLRAANWSFARKTADLVLLADATGNTPNVGTKVPTPWIYDYQYPIDCLKARFIPWNPASQISSPPAGNIQIPSTPLMTGLGSYLPGQRIRPARFQIATDYNYPPPAGSNVWETAGVSPVGRTVVLTNVQNAQLVYTALMVYPSVWDPLFRSAFVAYLASEIAFPLSDDKKFGLQVRAQQIAIVKQKLTEARLTDGNESVSSSDVAVDWMRTRNVGGGAGWHGPNSSGGEFGGNGGGYDGLMLADGATF